MGVVLAIAMGWSIAVPLAAFAGAFAVCILILLGHRLVGGGKLGLLVMGFVVSALCGALVSLILFLSDDMALRSAMTWLSGSFSEAGFVSPAYAGGVMLAGLVVLTAVGRRLDYLLLGDETAHTMGISVATTRMATIIGAALMTGAAVSLGGIIGFVGMMIPNVLAQAGGVLAFKSMEKDGVDLSDKVVYFMSIDNAKFRNPVRPGDKLEYRISVIKHQHHLCRQCSKIIRHALKKQIAIHYPHAAIVQIDKQIAIVRAADDQAVPYFVFAQRRRIAVKFQRLKKFNRLQKSITRLVAQINLCQFRSRQQA